MEQRLYNGEYFAQEIKYTGLNAADPVAASQHSYGGAYSAEAVALLKKEGPKYQYGTGCLSDGSRYRAEMTPYLETPSLKSDTAKSATS
jgi:hypothetical protein